MILLQRKADPIIFVSIIFALLCSFTTVAGPIMPNVSSSRTSTSTTRSILHSDGSIFEHANLTVPQPTEDDVSLVGLLSTWSSVVIPLAVVGLVAGVIRYLRRDPIIIWDE
ncbi:MAG: hypothetical protein ACFFCP_11425 [Promethearchaeota archaeon]